ncbi:helix-turn-helix transcriptional regulator [Mycobacterium simiae]|uniref:helix-turn-helix transcriptional regulator n=1 Tax=Mycobacterium simiae TaxID=1784 RepID=UPI0020CAC90A|nr:LuxR C-terminal-related transcriptional regulator [Mycobacterium simiae]
MTLLLADVEASTRLWHDQPEAMTTAVARLDDLLPGVVDRHHGVRPIEQGEGDGFVIAFSRASDALNCALELQQASLGPVRLRIGVHTGEAQLRDEGNYIGPTVNRAGRLRDLAHGGQTVFSGTAHDLVADQLPDQVYLSDLGTHRLRDLPRPERVFQVCHPALRTDFPPLRSGGGAARRHLPTQLTTFVGRSDQLGEIRQLIDANQLVTLTGAGGAGKTRLAVRVAALAADEFDGGAWFADLAPVTDPDNVISAMATGLGVPDQPGRATIDALVGFIGEQQLLVVVDNCEHLLSGVTAAAVTLLSTCPNLTILATSREPLGVPGEVTWRVPPLSPSGDGVELFIDRARRLQPELELSEQDSELIAEICGRLDGMPLAIELAAARLRSMSLAEIGESLGDRLRLLTTTTSGAAERQQTLAGSVDWSHALLTDTQRAVFRRLAVFRGGFDLRAAQFVAGDDQTDGPSVLDDLTALIDKSLVIAETTNRRTRYRLLETIRQYAQEKLVRADELDAVRARHRDHYTAVAIALDDPGHNADDRQIADIEIDFNNIRAAFRFSHDNGDADTALRMASSLQPFWLGRGRQGEGLAWLNAELSDTDRLQRVTPPVRARALADKAILNVWLGAVDTGDHAKQALEIAREIDDPFLLTRVLTACGAVHGYDPEGNLTYFEEATSIARDIGDKRRLNQILGWRAYGAFVAGDPNGMRAAAEEGRGLAESISNRVTLRQFRWLLALAQMINGDLDDAIAQFRQLAAEADAARDFTWRTINLISLARSLAYQGDAKAALGTAKSALDATAQLGPWYRGLGYAALATAAISAGDVDLADSAISAGFPAIDAQPELAARVSDYAAEAALAKGDLPKATRCSEAAVSSTTGWHLAKALTTRARISMAQGGFAQAERDIHDALSHSLKVQAFLGVPDSLELLAVLAGHNGANAQAARLFGAADAIRQASGESRFPHYEAAYREALAKVRDTLDAKDFDSAWSEGAALSVEEAIAYAQRGRGERKRPSYGWESLTPTEHEVVMLVSEGLPNKEIATRLFVSPKTVATHLTHIYSKLGIRSRVQLAQQASQWTATAP